MPNKTFIRRDSTRYSKIGKNRKKLQKWRRPKGRDNKMRLNRKSYPAKVKVGYKSSKRDSGKIDGKVPVVVYNLSDLERLGKENIAIIAKVGAKKKLEMIKHADEKKVRVINVKTSPEQKNKKKASKGTDNASSQENKK